MIEIDDDVQQDELPDDDDDNDDNVNDGEDINSLSANGRGITIKTQADGKKQTLISSGDQNELNKKCMENMQKITEKSKKEQLVDFKASTINTTVGTIDYRKDFCDTFNLPLPVDDPPIIDTVPKIPTITLDISKVDKIRKKVHGGSKRRLQQKKQLKHERDMQAFQAWRQQSYDADN